MIHTTAGRRAATRLIACAGAAALLLTGCSTADQGGSAGESRTTDDGRIAYLNLGNFSNASNPKPNYNPFSTTAIGPLWTIYDPLFEVNKYDCSEVPQLATEYEWTSPTEMRLTTREGVTWNDGEAFTAEDVAFTFTLLKKNPALDTKGVGVRLTSAEATSDTEVVLTFDGPAYAIKDKIIETTIVPEHVWAGVDDPATYTAEEAVGTGMFTVKSLNPQQFTVEANPDYWQADKVKVDELRFTKAAEGQVDQLRLARGEYDHNSMFVPDIEDSYVAKDPEHNKYWFASGSPISLYMNLTEAPFDDVEFRRAIAQAVDKERLTEEAGYGYVEPASQTLLVLPGQEDWLDPSIPDEGMVAYDPETAADALTAAGYELDADGKRLGKDGEPLAFTFTTPQGWSDWTAAADSVKDDFAELGIAVDVDTPDYPTVEQNRLTGTFDMAFGVRGGLCSMYQSFAEPLASENTAPVGKKASTNEVRWRDARTDALLEELEVTEDVEAQKPIVHELQQIMVDQVPFVPLWYGGKWFEYNTKHATGWPSAEDPYAGSDNNRLIYTSLVPAED
ncbi:ABC transporter substrate-binding protein [Isoptericola sp. BMS4]|uniref:ABC transporter substrate-binding protein n=1 Tax=Isoptericola sp. BMS4 TaxID=2527875 RepID=UPI001422070E|nr:ABC transporter substrate-binding protein [Isoptericola sp. BMS4]